MPLPASISTLRTERIPVKPSPPMPCLWFIGKAIDTVYICSCPPKCIQRQTATQDIVEVCARNSKHTAEKRLVYVSKAKANIFCKLVRDPVQTFGKIGTVLAGSTEIRWKVAKRVQLDQHAFWCGHWLASFLGDSYPTTAPQFGGCFLG